MIVNTYFCRCKVTTPQETEEDIQREIDELIDSWNIPEGMSLDEFIDRVNNGELEEIRAEQEKAAEVYGYSDSGRKIKHEDFVETLDNFGKSGIIEEKV